MNKLFAAVNFEIISPSQSALEFWRSAASVSYQSHRVVPHLELSETGVLNRADRMTLVNPYELRLWASLVLTRGGHFLQGLLRS